MNTEILTPGGMITLTKDEIQLLIDCLRHMTDCMLIKKHPCALDLVSLHNKMNTIDKRLNYEPVVFPLNVKVRRIKKRKVVHVGKTKKLRSHKGRVHRGPEKGPR